MSKIHPSISDAARARVGTRVRGKWRIDKLLGVGGMGAVYAATHRNGSRVALKILHPHLSTLEDIRARFAREGYAANAVNHPGIVRVLDDDETEDKAVFLVMDLLEGETADARARRQGGTIPIEDAVSIADGLLDVLIAAHSNGVVHRDIKPDNVFITRDGAIKVLDFGIARLRVAALEGGDSEAAASLRTRTGVTIGTPAFMPPEQALGRVEEVDALSDVWAVGATLYALLAGKIVHDAKTHMEVVIAAATAQAKSLGIAAPDVPKALVDVIDKALAFKKEDRHSSARAMQHALRTAFPGTKGASPGVASAGAASFGSDFPVGVGTGSQPGSSGSGERWAQERKRVTIVFGELVGLDELANDLEPDAVHELANVFFEPLSKLVAREGGTVLKYMGDSIMAVFGAPVAHEDDAMRGVRTALAMAECVREESTKRDVAVSFRAGVNTGLVMVGVRGAGNRATPEIVGATVNQAGAIVAAAASNEVLIGQATERIVREHFELHPAEPVAMKGTTDPLPIFRVEGEIHGDPASSMRLRSASGGSFFIRQSDLDLLLAIYETTLANKSMRFVDISGEMGLGKAFLLRELRTTLAARNPAPEVLHAPRILAPAPLGFVGKILRGRFNVRVDEAPEVVRDRVVGEVSRAWPDVEREDGREAGRLLGALVAPTQVTPLLETELWTDATRTASAFADWVRKLSRQSPVVMIVEQISWSDESTNELLQFLVRSLRRERVMLIVSTRPSPNDSPPPWLTANDIRTRVELHPFDDETMHRFLDDLFRLVPSVPRDIKFDIVKRAEGNPELCREVVRLLVDQGALEVDDRKVPVRWNKNAGAKLSLPDNFRGVLQSRIDRLPFAQKETLKMASVVGRTFWVGALADALKPEMTADEVATSLDALRRKELVKVEPVSVVSGERQYSFGTQALRDAAYETMPRSQSVAAHRKIAEWLGARGELWEGGHAHLAAHLEAAGEGARARRLYLNAARHAVSVSAYADAVMLFGKAIALWKNETSADDCIGRAGVLRERAAAESRTGRFDDALSSLDAAAADLRAVGVAAGDPVHAWVLFERGSVLKEYGRIGESIVVMTQARDMCRMHGPSVLHMRVCAALAYQRAAKGDRVEAQADVLDGQKLGQQLHMRDAGWHVAMARLKDAEGSLRFFEGDLAKAEDAYKAALEFRELAGDGPGMPDSFVNLGGVAYARGDFKSASAHYERALASAKKGRWAAREALGHSNLGQALLALGDLLTARKELDLACRLAEDAGYLDVLADSSRALVEAELAAGGIDEAVATADLAIERAKKSQNPSFVALAHGVAMDAWLAKFTRDRDTAALAQARVHKDEACDTFRGLNQPHAAETVQKRFGQGSNVTIDS